MIVTREQMLDTMNKPLTQSLFLEIGYSDSAIYTLKEIDHEFNGKSYPSLKRLYLEMADPTEYQFATTYLLGWRHWKRLCDNKLIRAHIDEWREELEVKLRCQGVKQIIATAGLGSFQASKWLTDRGWDTKGAGRPSAATVKGEKEFQSRVDSEYGADVLRLFKG